MKYLKPLLFFVALSTSVKAEDQPELFIGFNLNGIQDECLINEEDICTDILMPADEFAFECEEKGFTAGMCGCHDFLCSENIREKKDFTECSAEIDIDCPNGYIDGCNIEDKKSTNGLLTKYHVCVEVASTRGANICDQEIALQCDKNEIDACLTEPELAETHICVRQ